MGLASDFQLQLWIPKLAIKRILADDDV